MKYLFSFLLLLIFCTNSMGVNPKKVGIIEVDTGRYYVVKHNNNSATLYGLFNDKVFTGERSYSFERINFERILPKVIRINTLDKNEIFAFEYPEFLLADTYFDGISDKKQCNHSIFYYKDDKVYQFNLDYNNVPNFNPDEADGSMIEKKTNLNNLINLKNRKTLSNFIEFANIQGISKKALKYNLIFPEESNFKKDPSSSLPCFMQVKLSGYNNLYDRYIYDAAYPYYYYRTDTNTNKDFYYIKQHIDFLNIFTKGKNGLHRNCYINFREFEGSRHNTYNRQIRLRGDDSIFHNLSVEYIKTSTYNYNSINTYFLGRIDRFNHYRQGTFKNITDLVNNKVDTTRLHKNLQNYYKQDYISQDTCRFIMSNRTLTSENNSSYCIPMKIISMKRTKDYYQYYINNEIFFQAILPGIDTVIQQTVTSLKELGANDEIIQQYIQFQHIFFLDFCVSINGLPFSVFMEQYCKEQEKLAMQK